MDKALSFLQGKKSYFTMVLGIVLAILKGYCGIPIPDEVMYAICALLGITYKAGQNRTENAVKDLLEELKNAKNNP